MEQTHSAASLAAQIAEIQGDLVTMASREQQLVADYYRQRAESAEADAAGDIRRAAALLNQSVITAGLLTGIRREIAATQCRLDRLTSQAASEALAAHDSALILSRIAAGHAGMDDMAAFSAGAAA